jgi:hypothetical protein
MDSSEADSLNKEFDDYEEIVSNRHDDPHISQVMKIRELRGDIGHLSITTRPVVSSSKVKDARTEFLTSLINEKTQTMIIELIDNFVAEYSAYVHSDEDPVVHNGVLHQPPRSNSR